MSSYLKLALFMMLAHSIHTWAMPEGDISATTSKKSLIDKYIDDDDSLKCANDDTLNDCLKRVMGIMWLRLKDGDAELGIKSIDPFFLKRISFQYTNDPINGRITAKNVLLSGFADHVFKSVNVTLTKEKISMRNVGFVPKMYITGNYKADMSINSVHVKPKGEFNVTLLDVDITTIAEGEIYTENGHRFVRLIEIETNPQVGDLKVKANGIFPDPTLDEIILSVVNEYWRDVYSNILPETRRFWQPLVMQLVNEALKWFPVDRFIKD